jgi:GntR family transcriptional repressor for pyruvate dehydrogenase complex
MPASEARVTTRRSRPLKASDVLANDLRARILEENLRPGSPLPSESELIHDYSYSRGTVREALRLLEAEGFIQVQRGPKGGISVRHPDFNLVSRSMATLMVIGETPLADLFEFRKLVEPAAAKDVALHADAAQRQALTDYMKSVPAAHGDAGFHRLMGDCVRNDILRVTLTSLNRIIEWHMGFEQVSQTSVEEAGRAHERVVAAIVAGDGDAAEHLMLSHIRAFERVMGELGRLQEPTLPRRAWNAQLRQGLELG